MISIDSTNFVTICAVGSGRGEIDLEEPSGPSESELEEEPPKLNLVRLVRKLVRLVANAMF